MRRLLILGPRQLQKPLDQRAHLLRHGVDAGKEGLLLRRVIIRALQQLRVCQNDGQRRFQLVRRVGDKLLLLPPRFLHWPDRTARQQHRKAEKGKQAECTEQHAVFYKRAQRLLLAGNVREDHAAGHAAVAQAVFRDLADGVP